MSSPDYGYPAHWAPRHARQRQEQREQATAARFEHLNSGCPASAHHHSASDAYPSDWTPKKGEVKE